MNRNNTSFPIIMTNEILKILSEYNEGDKKNKNFLKYYQYVILKLFHVIEKSKTQNGLLINHKMGMGKTYLALSISAAMSRLYDIIFIAPKSLHTNFTNSIDKFEKLSNRKINKNNIEIITFDSYNLIKSIFKKRKDLTKTLIIVDEAHNFFRGIINNPNGNSGKLYSAIMSSKNIKLLFLTGTFPAKSFFEMVPCFNMLTGSNILPENYDEFVSLYIDETNNRLKNTNFLANRLLGLVSYASLSLLKSEGDIPTLKPEIVVRTNMSDMQYRSYLIIRDKENAEFIKAQKSKKQVNLKLPRSNTSSTYYVMSRTKSTYCPGGYEYENSPKISKMIDIIEKSPGPVIVYTQFIINGIIPTMHFLRKRGFVPFNIISGYEDDESYKNVSKKTLFETSVLSKEKYNKDIFIKRDNFSVDRISWALEYVFNYGDSDDIYVIRKNNTDIPISGFSKLKNASDNKFKTIDVYYTDRVDKYFAVISGDVLPQIRDKIKNEWNNIKNIRGDRIFILLISETGIEGLDLKYGRQAHILTYPWTENKVRQFVGRIVRLGSHSDLPPEDRNVEMYIHLSVPNMDIYDKIPESKREKETIDERFYNNAKYDSELNDDIEKFMQRISLECCAYKYEDCYICNPTDEKLFKSTPREDMSHDDPCHSVESIDKDLKKFVYKGKTYYYSDDKNSIVRFKIYEFDEKLNMYVDMQKDNKDYFEIYKTIFNLNK